MCKKPILCYAQNVINPSLSELAFNLCYMHSKIVYIIQRGQFGDSMENLIIMINVLNPVAPTQL